MRVNRLPADTVARLRMVTLETLKDKLGVLAQWQLKGGVYVPVAPGKNLSEGRGVRRDGDELQMGLSKSEISGGEPVAPEAAGAGRRRQDHSRTGPCNLRDICLAGAHPHLYW